MTVVICAMIGLQLRLGKVAFHIVLIGLKLFREGDSTLTKNWRILAFVRKAK